MTSPIHSLDCREKQEALDRVLQSQVFARADLLRKFLSYVCSIEMAGRGQEITEYSIGVEALGRPNNFSPTEDSTVRGRARDLRIKLDQFYESEGSDTTIRISFQKGSYVPAYVKSNPGGQRLEALKPQEFLKPVPARTRTWALPVICALIGAALAGAAFFIFVPARRIDPVVREFWGPLLRPDGNVLVVLGTPLSLTFRHIDLPPEVARSKPAPPEVEEWLKDQPWLNPIGRLYMLRQWSPLFGDAAAAVTAAQTLSGAGVPFQLLQEASIRPSVLRSRNVLLIGAPSYSAYAARVLRNTPFTIQNDTSTPDEVISGAPVAGQPSKPAFLSKRDERGRTSVVYGLITVVPSGPRPEIEARTVIISGMGGAGAQAAMEFFSSAASLRLLQRQFRKDSLTRVPLAYQVVVRCTMDQSLLMNWDLAAFKTIDPSRLLD